MAVTTLAATSFAELVHWRASKWDLPDQVPSGSCALMVLGCRTGPDGRLQPMQKWRVEIARRAMQALGAEMLVFSGAPSRGRPAEAEAMAAYAERLGVPRAHIAIENRATSTRENIAFSVPMVTSFDRLAFISDPLHAARARRYLRAEHPDLAARLVGAGEYRPFEHVWLKTVAAAYELYRAQRGPVSSRRR
jgi:vancomycin permeability regulator SanA